MGDVIFFNKLAELRSNPTLKNLLDLAKLDSKQTDIEINDFAYACRNIMTDRENVFWLIGYIQGLCAVVTLGSHKEALKELEERIDKYCLKGNFRYRIPYKPTVIQMP